MSTASGSASGTPPADLKRKKRTRAFTADERASHRVIEKQRREALNESFLDLARLVPALAPARRLSKSLIVHESIQHFRAQRAMCLAAADEFRAIIEDNIELVAEVNRWRSQYGPSMEPRQIKAVGESAHAVLNVDQDVLGTFPGGFGDNGSGEYHDDEQGPGGQQLEQRASLTQSQFAPEVAPPIATDTNLNPTEYTSTHPLFQLDSATPDINHLYGFPSGFRDLSAQYPTSDEDPFSFLNNAYDAQVIPLTDVPPDQELLENLGMGNNLFHDFTIPTPEMAHFVSANHDEPIFGNTL